MGGVRTRDSLARSHRTDEGGRQKKKVRENRAQHLGTPVNGGFVEKHNPSQVTHDGLHDSDLSMEKSDTTQYEFHRVGKGGA